MPTTVKPILFATCAATIPTAPVVAQTPTFSPGFGCRKLRLCDSGVIQSETMVRVYGEIQVFHQHLVCFQGHCIRLEWRMQHFKAYVWIQGFRIGGWLYVDHLNILVHSLSSLYP